MKTTFLSSYRKAQSPEQTHFCPGCGHGSLLKFVDEAICSLGAAERTVWVSPVGCGGLTDSYMSISHILAAHGRASAVATAVKRLKPEAVVIVSQGDGDLASIGLLEAVHAACRCENLTVFFMNNANFGMTGGQMAPTSLLGQKTATSPWGRLIEEHGAPIKICELLDTLDGPAYIARVAIGSERQIAQAQKVIRRAVENQIAGRGYSFVEILSPCPSNWHCTPAEARDRVAEEMTRIYPLGIFRDISREDRISARMKPERYTPEGIAASFEALSKPVRVSDKPLFALRRAESICCAGFGGQGIMTLGRMTARLALMSGYESTWIPSYGPEMRGGAANCFVRIDRREIAAPVVDAPTTVVAMNQPAFDKFAPRIAQNGIVLYDSDAVQAEPSAQYIGIPASTAALELDSPKNTNMVLLGAMLRHVFGIGADEIDAVITALGADDIRGEAIRRGSAL